MSSGLGRAGKSRSKSTQQSLNQMQFDITELSFGAIGLCAGNQYNTGCRAGKGPTAVLKGGGRDCAFNCKVDTSCALAYFNK